MNLKLLVNHLKLIQTKYYFCHLKSIVAMKVHETFHFYNIHFLWHNILLFLMISALCSFPLSILNHSSFLFTILSANCTFIIFLNFPFRGKQNIWLENVAEFNSSVPEAVVLSPLVLVFRQQIQMLGSTAKCTTAWVTSTTSSASRPMGAFTQPWSWTGKSGTTMNWLLWQRMEPCTLGIQLWHCTSRCWTLMITVLFLPIQHTQSLLKRIFQLGPPSFK